MILKHALGLISHRKIGKEWYLFLIILLLGLYLRFYGIQEAVPFGWDQGRDAWVVREIIQGKLTLIGPRTGIGHFHLGPVYYYLLAPFFYLTHLDPMASNYLNILCNIINFVILFVVAKTIFNSRTGLIVILIYATSLSMMTSRIPWNVTLMPGLSALIFFSIFEVYQGQYKWVFLAWLLSGFFFNIHFTAIFFPPILIASFVFVKDKIKVLRYSLISLPLYAMWFIPNVIHELLNANSDLFRMRDFLRDYYIGFHGRFMLHRLPDALIQFSSIINYPPIMIARYIIPVVFLIVAFLGNNKDRLVAYLISIWFIVPLIGFTLYGGPISDYYFLSSAPMVLLILGFFADKLYKINNKLIYVTLIVCLGFYIFWNTKDSWIKPRYGGLTAQKDSVKKQIKQGRVINFKEGEISSYLYSIWVKDGKRF